MLDEADRARLAEMGIDVYLPRARAAGSTAPVSDAAAASAAKVLASSSRSPGAAARVLVLADPSMPGRLPGEVMRALAFGRIEVGSVDVTDEAALASAAVLVLFGDGLARRVGAALPAQRQREIGWVVTAEPSALARDPRGKRALWSELKRVMRTLSSDGATRAMRGAGVVEPSKG